MLTSRLSKYIERKNGQYSAATFIDRFKLRRLYYLPSLCTYPKVLNLINR